VTRWAEARLTVPTLVWSASTADRDGSPGPMRRDARRFGVLVAAAMLFATVVVAAAPAGAADASAPPALDSVSCADGANCVAVGTRVIGALDKTLVKSWNGTTWTVVPSPNPPGKTSATLNTVTCPSSTNCIAVGNYSTTSWSRTLIEQWDGTGWKIVAAPNPHGLTFAALDGLACPSTTSCYAVGNYSTKSWSRTLVEHWDGASWKIVASPNPPGQTFAIVGSISCPTRASCYAVGFYMNDATTKTLVERWNGTRWTIVDSPNPAPGLLEFAGLGAVACVSSVDCYAVGFAVTGVGSRALIEHWNGTAWAIAAGPVQAGALDFPALLGVACASSTNCHAVGFSSNTTLIDRWDGTKWSTDTT
jgi:hypothetical protein